VRQGPGADDRAVDVVEVFADVCCPFTHVGLRRFVERRAALGRHEPLLVVRAWPLELVNGEPLDGDFIAEEIEALRGQVAPDLFTGFRRGFFPSTSLPALALAAGAYRVDVRTGEQVSLALRDALFERGIDIGDDRVLDAIAAIHGLDRPGEAEHAAVRSDWEDGRRRGVRGSPEFFVAGRGYFCPTLDISRVDGQLQIRPDPEALDEFLGACLAA
jgi:2-hydroxychromene-2-carboxylate isomerase